MSSSIKDILSTNNNPQEPAEFDVIRRFVLQNYQSIPKLQISHNSIIITVPNAALAGELRLQLHELQELCDTDKKLLLRIG